MGICGGHQKKERMITFLSIETLKSRGLIGDNVDVKVILPIIEEVQDQYIQPIVGTSLYEDLKARVNAGTVSSGSPSYTTLLDDYIIPCMIRYAEAEILQVNTFKIAQKGTQTKNGEHNQPATMSEMINIEQGRRNKAEWYAQRITDYLIANINTYPKYQSQTRTDAIYPNGTSYESGIYLGDSDDECTPREEKWREIR
jgi:hypothetical protein